jgi:hypothetical protein
VDDDPYFAFEVDGLMVTKNRTIRTNPCNLGCGNFTWKKTRLFCYLQTQRFS